jgi:hypothetical protein
MDIAGLVARFLFYAQEHQDVLHDPAEKSQTAFALFDLENINEIIKNGVKFPCILLQTPEIVKQGEHDSTIEQYEFAFMVLKPLPKRDLSLKPGIIQDCKNISDEIYNRLLLDTDNGMFDGGLTNTAEGIVGPIGDQLYGWGVNLGFDQGYNAVVDPSKWGDLL